MKINIVGNCCGTSGFAIHTSCLAKALIDEGFDVSVETHLPPGWEASFPTWLREACEKRYHDELNIVIGFPDTTQYVMSDRPKGVIQFLINEGDRIPPMFVPILNDERILQVWVASEDTKTAAINSGVNADKIFVVSHGVDTSIFKPLITKVNKDKFRFFYLKGWSKGVDDRGGVSDLLKAFSEEFGKDEPVELMIKINSVYNNNNWSIEEEVKKLNLNFKQNVKLIINELSEQGMVNLYNECDVFVAPTRGEAFGFPIAEALACGKPVLVTDKGGHLDFCKGSHVHFIKSELKPSPELPFYEGINWNYCINEDLKKQLRMMYETYDGKKVNAEEIGKKITEEFTWKHTVEKVKKCLELLNLS